MCSVQFSESNVTELRQQGKRAKHGSAFAPLHDNSAVSIRNYQKLTIISQRFCRHAQNDVDWMTLMLIQI